MKTKEIPLEPLFFQGFHEKSAFPYQKSDLWHLGILGEPSNPAFPFQCSHMERGISLTEPGEAKIPNSNFGLRAVFLPGPASGTFLLHSRGNTRVEEACEMYTRAANMFKIAKNWSGESKSWDLGGCG